MGVTGHCPQNGPADGPALPPPQRRAVRHGALLSWGHARPLPPGGPLCAWLPQSPRKNPYHCRDKGWGPGSSAPALGPPDPPPLPNLHLENDHRPAPARLLSGSRTFPGNGLSCWLTPLPSETRRLSLAVQPPGSSRCVSRGAWSWGACSGARGPGSCSSGKLTSAGPLSAPSGAGSRSLCWGLSDVPMCSRKRDLRPPHLSSGLAGVRSRAVPSACQAGAPVAQEGVGGRGALPLGPLHLGQGRALRPARRDVGGQQWRF